MASSFVFQDLIENLEDIGFYDVALPFLLIFTITFAVLQKIRLFGQSGKNFNAVVALVLAFLVVRTPAIVEVMNVFLPKISLISIFIVVILLLVGIVVSPTQSGFSGALGGIGILLTIVGIIIAFLTSTDALGWDVPEWLQFSKSDWYFIIGLLVFLLIFLYLTSTSDPVNKQPNPLWGWIKDLPKEAGRE